VPTPLGAHNARIDVARALLTKKGRREQRRFTVEGPTLLHEALAARVPIEEIYVTRRAFEETPAVGEAEGAGVAVYFVDDRSMSRISDVDTPSGILAIVPIALQSVPELLAEPGVVLALADVNDPGNAGTLLRSAEAFGVTRVIFGSRGAEPHLPKVVRGAMGAIFRLRIAVAAPADLQPLLTGWEVTGLAAQGEPLDALRWHSHNLLAVGNERHGLGAWRALCTRLGAISMRGAAESLNAGVAGSIALYEATKHPNI
jgi:RNA methyltransferase, TrmH family